MSTVKLHKLTWEILQNFSTINSSILIREGNVIKTISVSKNAVAQYESEDEFPQTFGIYDLTQFLSGYSLHCDISKGNTADLEFSNDSYVTIRGNGRSAKYFFSDPNITLQSVPETNIKFPGADFSFSVSTADLVALQKASSVYGLPDLAFRSFDDGTVNLELCDKENDTSHVYSQTVQGESTGTYEFFMRVENLRLYQPNASPNDMYHVKVSKHLITEWQHDTLKLKYYIALEP